MSMDKWLCAVVGENHSEFKNYHIDTKKRIRALGVLIHIPVLIWAGIGFQVASDIFKASLPFSIMSSFLLGLVIYAVEYSIIQIKNTGWKENRKQTLFLGGMRLVLAFLMAVIGSFIIDEKLFEQDISKQLRSDNTAINDMALSKRNESINKLYDKQRELTKILRDKSLEAQKEFYGKGVSGKIGEGPNYTMIKEDRDTADKQLKDFYKQRIEDLKHIENDYKMSTTNANINLTNSGLLTRATALHDYISENIIAKYLFVAFLIAMGILELLVLVVKLFSGKSVDDEINELKASVLREEARARNVIRIRKLEVVKNTYDPRLERAKAVLSGIN